MLRHILLSVRRIILHLRSSCRRAMGMNVIGGHWVPSCLNV